MKNVLSFLKKLSFSLLFGFILLEVALRIHNPVPFTVKKGKVTLPANKTYVFKNKNPGRGKEVIVHKHNSLGFRGQEPPENFEDYLSIITVGGSTTHDYRLTEGETWTDQLGLNLEKQFNNVWVNNAGIIGHSTFGHQLLAQDYLAAIKPKIVMFLIGINDVETEDFRHIDKNIMIGSLDFRNIAGFLQSLNRNVEVFNLANGLFRTYLAKKRKLDLPDLDLPNQKLIDTSDEKREEVLNYSRLNFVIPYRKRIVELAEICKANDIHPVFITQPALYGDLKDDVTGVDLGRVELHSGRNGKLTWDLLELYNDQVRYLAEDGTVDMIDLARTLPKTSRLFYSYIHYTEEGAKVVASIIDEKLSEIIRARFPEFRKDSRDPISS